MANSTSHAALPYPIRKARFTLALVELDADGDPTDPTTPDTEFSLDNSAYADCAEERTTVSGSLGSTFITLTGAETDGSLLYVAGKVASGPKVTVAVLYPKNLAVLTSGTAGAGAASTLTLALDAFTPLNLTGCFIRTTGGTGGGGTGGANNQARRIISYVQATRVATVSPNWETTPDNTTTYDILLPEGVVASQLSGGGPKPIAAGTVGTYTSLTEVTITAHATIRRGDIFYATGGTGIGNMAVILSHNSGSGVTTFAGAGLQVAASTDTTYEIYAGPNFQVINTDASDNMIANVRYINDVEVDGAGTSGDKWRAA